MPHPDRSPAIARAWRFHGILRSCQWGKGGVVKNRAVFVDHIERDALLALLDEAATANVDRPSSYADLLHKKFRSPMLTGPAQRALQFDIPGAWQELTIGVGRYSGIWRRYDMRSAYLWATQQGLPNPSSYRYAERIGKRAGLFFCDLAPKDGAPYPYRLGGCHPVTPEEIERYGLTVLRVHWGVTWSQPYDVTPIVDNICRWSCWKAVARSFWGRWLSNGKVQCETWKHGERSKQWDLPLPFANPIWAHLIVGRVRARLYDVAANHTTARVYVDSVVVEGELPTGPNIGDWKLEETFQGLDVRHLNIYRSWLAGSPQ